MDAEDNLRDGDRHQRPSFTKETPTRTMPAARVRSRTEPRIGVDSNIVLHLIDLAAQFRGRIVDISMGGCHIRTDTRFSLGIFRRIEIEFRIEGLPFRLGGVTQAVYDPFNVGIRFLDVSERKQEQLHQLIEEIKAMQCE